MVSNAKAFLSKHKGKMSLSNQVILTENQPFKLTKTSCWQELKISLTFVNMVFYQTARILQKIRCPLPYELKESDKIMSQFIKQKIWFKYVYTFWITIDNLTCLEYTTHGWKAIQSERLQFPLKKSLFQVNQREYKSENRKIFFLGSNHYGNNSLLLCGC